MICHEQSTPSQVEGSKIRGAMTSLTAVPSRGYLLIATPVSLLQIFLLHVNHRVDLFGEKHAPINTIKKLKQRFGPKAHRNEKTGSPSGCVCCYNFEDFVIHHQYLISMFLYLGVYWGYLQPKMQAYRKINIALEHRAFSKGKDRLTSIRFSWGYVRFQGCNPIYIYTINNHKCFCWLLTDGRDMCNQTCVAGIVSASKESGFNGVSWFP